MNDIIKKAMDKTQENEKMLQKNENTKISLRTVAKQRKKINATLINDIRYYKGYYSKT